jgi:hypothetical protein
MLTFISVAGSTMEWYDSQGWDLLMLQLPVWSGSEIESQKGRRFKIFWIPQHLKEGILVNGSRKLAIINPIGTIICPDKENKIQQHGPGWAILVNKSTVTLGCHM